MPGSILQVSVSGGGVPKTAIPEALVTPLGLEGDAHAHNEIHGGPRQALLLITSEGLDELKAAGFPLFWGAMGENLTTRGLDRRAMRPGQRYRAGTAVIELTKIRVPCATLHVYSTTLGAAVYDAAVKAGDWASPRWGLSGFYAQVMEPGIVRPGDAIEWKRGTRQAERFSAIFIGDAIGWIG